jgi:hypothetical protein
MKPVEHAAELCRRRGGNFRVELEAHLLRGWVFSTPEAFLMGRAVPRSVNADDLEAEFAPEECDAWYVWLGVGPASRLLSWMPYELPWIGWYRQGRGWADCHWAPTSLLRRKIVRVSTCIPAEI